MKIFNDLESIGTNVDKFITIIKRKIVLLLVCKLLMNFSSLKLDLILKTNLINFKY